MFGKLVEQELLGQVKKEKIPFGRVEEMETTYLGYKPAIEYVKMHQRGSPHHPTLFFPKSLYESLAKELDITNDEQLAYYTAIGSAFDRYHGIDAFFEYIKSDGKKVRATIDVTMNPNKDRYKADVILAIPNGGLDPADENYNDLIGRYTEQVKEVLLTR